MQRRWRFHLIASRSNFYLSGYLEAHRDEYYERLLAVSRDDDWTSWCVFFLGAVTAQAEANRTQAEAILALYNQRKSWIVEAIPSQYAVRALDWMFTMPIFRTVDFGAGADVPAPTARRILRLARDGGLLKVVIEGSGRRGTVLAFPELLNIAEGRDIF